MAKRNRKRARPRLAAGRAIEFAFPKLPRTLYARHTGEKIPPTMAVHLPRDYTARKRFPLVVYLDGGRGAPGNAKGLAKVKKLTAGRGFIGASLPLFKKELDPEEVHGGLLIAAHDDYPMMARAYRVMLNRLVRAIPNIDFDRSAFGGFSNGAHTTGILLSALHPTVLRCFRHFYLVEGGRGIASFHKTALREKNFLFMVGARRGDASRRAWLRAIENTYVSARERGLNATFRRMKGVRHGFPAEQMPVVREWIVRMNAKA